MLKIPLETLATYTQQAISNFQNRTCVKLAFKNRRYPTAEIQKVSGWTAASPVALNRSSRPRKQRKYSQTSTYSQLVASKLVAAMHMFSSLGVA